MKPPPRSRTKPNRSLEAELVSHSSGKLGSKWQRPEQKKLLNALKKLSSCGGTQREMDHVYLKTCVSTRSLAEIRAMVESLKNKAILCAGRTKRLEERDVRKPIEEWTHVASTVAGILEENISSAFSQMLIVSSTEPCTLRSFDPLQVYRPHTKACPVGHTAPIRPPPFLPVQGQHPDIRTANSVLMFKSPAPAISPARTFRAPCQVVTVANSKISLLQQRLPLTGTTSSSPSPVIFCQAASSQSASANVSPAPGPRQMHKYTKDSPRMTVKCDVDFEKIFCLLSGIQNPSEDCHLTPVESAILLDLLMSLPEELPQLDCNKLHNHIVQVYQYLTAPADSKATRELFPEWKAASTQRVQNFTGAGGHHNTTSDVMDSVGEKMQQPELDSQTPGTPNTFSQTSKVGVCPPLNPFMVPLKLLTRRRKEI